MVAEFRQVFVKSDYPPDVFRSRGLSSRKRLVRGCPTRPHHVVVRPRDSRAATWCGRVLAPLRLVFSPRESLGKIGGLQLFPEFFLKVDFFTQKQDTRAILLKTTLVCVSCIKNAQNRGNNRKSVRESGYVWTYQLPPS